MVGDEAPAAAGEGTAPPVDPADEVIPPAPFEGMPNTAPPLDDDDDGEEDEAPPEPERSSVMYSCLRCNTPSPGEELDRLPEIKCICGFRVFVKNRPPIPKTIRAV